MVDVTVTGLAAQGDSASRPAPRSGLVPWILSSAAMLLLLLLPALWNGFPLIFPDTGGYLARPLEGTLDLGRSALYGLFLVAGLPLAFWPVVIVQSALTIWLVVLTMRAHGLGGRPWLALGIVALLSSATSLPWLAGQLLPDVWFPAAVMALYLLAFRDATLALWERLLLACVIAFAIASHMAAAGLCVGLIAALWLLGRLPRLDMPKPRLIFAVGAVAVGILLCPVSNWAIAGKFAFTPGGSSFLFGRLVEDGIVSRYLEDRCPDPALRLCPYKAELADYDGDDWLWDPDSPFRKLDGWEGIGDEERDIILATLARYPLIHIVDAVSDIFDQLTSFQTEVSLDDNAPTIGAFHDWAPHLLPQLMRARQQTGRINVSALNLVHVPVAALAMAGLLAAMIFRRPAKLAPELAALAATVLLALFVNAAICAVCSHAVDRYQSRLAPLALFVVALTVVEGWRRTRLGATRDLS
ncbi:MAG TPA: hypothetical protein VMI47_13830 [Pseudolabrys sp.]|nr:hypothetical protein [Pseudolabrys sp.]